MYDLKIKYFERETTKKRLLFSAVYQNSYVETGLNRFFRKMKMENIEQANSGEIVCEILDAKKVGIGLYLAPYMLKKLSILCDKVVLISKFNEINQKTPACYDLSFYIESENDQSTETFKKLIKIEPFYYGPKRCRSEWKRNAWFKFEYLTRMSENYLSFQRMYKMIFPSDLTQKASLLSAVKNCDGEPALIITMFCSRNSNKFTILREEARTLARFGCGISLASNWCANNDNVDEP